jgi:threonyl-tRNA synthetase
VLLLAYGTSLKLAWADKKQLAAYIKRIEEAEKRDHRKIGKALDLFHMQEEAPGMVCKIYNLWCFNLKVTVVLLNFTHVLFKYLVNSPAIWMPHCGKNQVMRRTMLTTCLRLILKIVTMPLSQ